MALSSIPVREDPDLRARGSWAPAHRPGWEPVAAICRIVHERLEELAGAIVDAIVREVPDYAGPEAVPRADVHTSVYRNVEMMLLGIAEHRGPREEELDVRRQLGRRRAIQGVPLQSLTGAYHVGYRELWAALVAEALGAGGAAPGLLLTGGALLWDWNQTVINAVAEEYQRETAQRQAAAALERAHFFDLLLRDPSSDECIALARGLGFDPDASFLAIAFSASGTSDARLLAAVDHQGGVAASSTRGRIAHVVMQDVTDLDRVVAFAGRAVGVGLERVGLQGARLSVTDAERALELAAHRGAVTRFEDDWLAAIVLSLRNTVAPLLEHGADVAAEQRHLAETVRAFADADLSLAEGARRQRLSPTSFRHRLDRWHRLTGWDPWTWDGLSRSLMAIELAATRSDA